jgi:hypothetical protein
VGGIPQGHREWSLHEVMGNVQESSGAGGTTGHGTLALVLLLPFPIILHLFLCPELGPLHRAKDLQQALLPDTLCSRIAGAHSKGISGFQLLVFGVFV